MTIHLQKEYTVHKFTRTRKRAMEHLMVQHCSFALPRHFEFNLEKNIEEIACCVRERGGRLIWSS